jgi:hypothetical protein
VKLFVLHDPLLAGHARAGFLEPECGKPAVTPDKLAGVAFAASRGQTGSANNLMPKLLLTNPKGKLHSTDLVSASNSQRPNESQMRDLDQINRRLPPNILTELAARGLIIPPREIGLLLSRLKAADDLEISIGE